jgi:hypothetical protein
LSALAIRPPLPLQERNTFLEAVASICERREWRDYARGMYDETNFTDVASDVTGLKGMVAAMERFRDYEKMSYQCVAIAMEYLSKKNFSSTAVEYCGRVLGMKFRGGCADYSCCVLLFSRGGSSIGACIERCDTVHGEIT